MVEDNMIVHSESGHSFGERFGGALRLDPAIYDDVARDPSAAREALAVVGIAGLAAAVGVGESGVDIVLAPVNAVLAWLVGPVFLWLMAYLVNAPIGYRVLLRVLGFAWAPTVLLAFARFGAGVVGAVVFCWSVAAWIVAVRQTFKVTTGAAILIGILANVAEYMTWLAIRMVLAAVSGGA